MKYIRTKDGKIVELKPHRFYKYVLEGEKLYLSGKGKYLYINNVISQAVAIEELCDKFVRISLTGRKNLTISYKIAKEEKLKYKDKLTYYGAVWTDKGLIYVAKMNEEGVLCLI